MFRLSHNLLRSCPRWSFSTKIYQRAFLSTGSVGGSGDLSGILVVSLEQAIAAPLASSKLALAGARVIKVERPDGGDFARSYDKLVKGESANFVWVNRGKESLALNFKNKSDHELLLRILSRADVFIQNLAPGAAERSGVGSKQLRDLFPKLITCDIGMFPSGSEHATRGGYDLLVQAESALCSLTGTADSPARVGVSVCDIAAGLSAHAAILQALIARNTTGEGCSLEVSLFSATADWMTVPWLQYAYSGVVPVRAGVAHPTIVPYGAFNLAGRDDVILIAVQNDREWARLCKHVIDAPTWVTDAEFATNPARLQNRKIVDKRVADKLGSMTRTQASTVLTNANIPFGFLNALKHFNEHPCLTTLPTQTPSGEIRTIAPPVRVDGSFPAVGAIPGLGQHTDSIRREFQQA